MATTLCGQSRGILLASLSSTARKPFRALPVAQFMQWSNHVAVAWPVSRRGVATEASGSPLPPVTFTAPPNISSPLQQSGDLVITPAAARRLSALRSRAGADPVNFALRVRVDGGGCSGFKYSFEIENVPPAEDDRIFSAGDARVVVDSVSLDLVRGSTLEWIDEMMRNCFALVNNPQSASSCGCGSSFAAKA